MSQKRIDWCAILRSFGVDKSTSKAFAEAASQKNKLISDLFREFPAIMDMDYCADECCKSYILFGKQGKAELAQTGGSISISQGRLETGQFSTMSEWHKCYRKRLMLKKQLKK